MFGKTIENLPDEKTFKSLTPEQEKENETFTAMRKNALVEAIKIQKENKKVFGGGKSRIMDHNIRKIIDKGYTVEQAKHALKLSRNNLERAFTSLKKQNNRGTNNTEQNSGYSGRGGSGGYNTGRGSGKDERLGKKSGKNKDDVIESKPSGKINLFDFFESKLPQAPEPTVSSVKKTETNSLSNKSNNMNSNKYQNYSSNNTTTSNNQNSNNKTSNSASGSSSSRQTGNNTNRYAQYDTKNKDKKYEEKTKFENNISASFRQKKEDPIPMPANAKNSSSSMNTKPTNSNPYSSNKRTNFPINNKTNMMNSNNYNNNYNTSESINPSGGYQNSNYQNLSGGNMNHNQKPQPNKNMNEPMKSHVNVQNQTQQMTQPPHQQYNNNSDKVNCCFKENL